MSKTAQIVFGCGHFWSREHLFSQLLGVTSTRVGFMGGWTHNPSYQDVSGKMTGHAEVVEVTYDTTVTRFPQLLKAFFSFHDACRDRTIKGGQYRSVVFYRKAKERIIAERAVELLRKNGVEVTTKVEPAQIFWEAEKQHQGYAARSEGYDKLAPNPALDAATLEEAATQQAKPVAA